MGIGIGMGNEPLPVKGRGRRNSVVGMRKWPLIKCEISMGSSFLKAYPAYRLTPLDEMTKWENPRRYSPMAEGFLPYYVGHRQREKP